MTARKMSKKSLMENMKKFVGKDVLLINKHPKEGSEGKTIRVDEKTMSMIVELSTGEEISVRDPKYLFFIVSKQRPGLS